jgi:hypothetical protein
MGSAPPCRQRLRGLPLLLALALPWAAPPAVRSQDLVGCQLVDGTLQCVPGLTADPQQQIRILEGQIQRDQVLEGAVEQSISGLRELVLQGEARVGQRLTARIDSDRIAGLPDSAYHWYRRPAGQGAWQLIPGASGASYTLGPADVSCLVLVVVAVPSEDGSRRSASAPQGPVQAAGAAP